MFPTSEILARLDRLVEEATRWGPALPVALLFGVALLEAVLLPRRWWVRGVAVLVVVLCGTGAGVLLHWEQRTSHGKATDQMAAETSALRGLWAQWDALSRSLPPTASEVPAKFDTVDDALASLSAKVASIGDQIAQVAARKEAPAGRSIDPASAVKLADLLRQYGSYRVIVSCVPGDDEAYFYANQLVGILKAAGWDANGPEATVNIADGSAMGITVLMRDPTAPDAAKILLNALGQLRTFRISRALLLTPRSPTPRRLSC